MATLKQIQDDPAFCLACDRANRKAQKAADRVREKLRRAEEKEIKRHREAMQKIDRARNAIYRGVYSAVYDPIEQAAFDEANNRIDAAEAEGQANG